MSRPLPVVILQSTNKDNTLQLLPAELQCMFVVTYDGKEIRIKNVAPCSGRMTTTTHSNIGHALNQRDKLNKRFNTTLFEVYELELGRLVK